VVDDVDAGEDISSATFSLTQVKAAFPDLDLITMTDRGPMIVG
jgi:hypothetical protein